MGVLYRVYAWGVFDGRVHSCLQLMILHAISPILMVIRESACVLASLTRLSLEWNCQKRFSATEKC